MGLCPRTFSRSLRGHDPFDRILIARALQRGLTLATVDDAVRLYPVPLLPLA